MVSISIYPSSIIKGLLRMKIPHGKVNWAIKFVKVGSPLFWIHFWTPIWHRGRGPYLSMGIGPLAIYRGY
jgi:hypothetical protein